MIVDPDSFAIANQPYLLALAFFGFLACAFLLINRGVEIRERMRERALAFKPIHQTRKREESPDTPTFTTNSDVQSQLEQASELLYRIERGLGDGKDRAISRVRTELVQAGYFHSNALFWFYFSRALLAFGLGTLPLAVIAIMGLEVSPLILGFVCLVGATLGLITPGVYLGYRKSFIRRQCRSGFPDFLDLLVVCTQAGIPPRAAFERISRDLSLPYPYLGANLFLSYLQIRAGLPLVDAIEGLGRRINLQEIRSFGLLLKQTEELGTKLSDALRVYSHDMRTRRMLRAEEKAHALPVKLVLPLALFVFPVMLIVIFVPILIRVKAALF